MQVFRVGSKHLQNELEFPSDKDNLLDDDRTDKPRLKLAYYGAGLHKLGKYTIRPLLAPE